MNSKIVIGLGVIVVIISLIVNVWIQRSTTVIENCKVLSLREQSLLKGSGESLHTEIRYLVITDKETFICESSLFNGKFDNSDIFWRLKQDSVYTFKVAGIGKSFISDYRNIIEYK